MFHTCQACNDCTTAGCELVRNCQRQKQQSVTNNNRPAFSDAYGSEKKLRFIRRESLALREKTCDISCKATTDIHVMRPVRAWLLL